MKINNFFKKIFKKDKKTIYLIEENPYSTKFEIIGFVDTEEKAEQYCKNHTKQYYQYRYTKLESLE